MAVIVPTSNDKEAFETHYIELPNKSYRPISTGEANYVSTKSVTYTQSDYTGGEEGVTGNGDVPQFNHIPESITPADSEAPRSNDTIETGDGSADKLVTPTSGAWGALEGVLMGHLGQARGGGWAESPSNRGPHIDKCVAWTRLNPTGGYPWCAAYVSWALDQAGVATMRSASSQAWKGYGIEVGIGNWNNVRKNDIIIFSYGGGSGHIGFFRGYNKASRRVNILGGNQGNNLCIKSFSTAKITSIKRNWSLPSDQDVPLFIEQDAPRGGGFSDTR